MGQQPRAPDADGHAGELQLDGLVLADRLAERLALGGVARRRLERGAGDADAGGGHVDAAPVERGEHLVEPAPLDAAEQVRRRHLGVVEAPPRTARRPCGRACRCRGRSSTPACPARRAAGSCPGAAGWRRGRSRRARRSGSAWRAWVIIVFVPDHDVVVAAAGSAVQPDRLQVAARRRLRRGRCRSSAGPRRGRAR